MALWKVWHRSIAHSSRGRAQSNGIMGQLAYGVGFVLMALTIITVVTAVLSIIWFLLNTLLPPHTFFHPFGSSL